MLHVFAWIAGALFAVDIALQLFAVLRKKEGLRSVTKVLLMPLLVFTFSLIWLICSYETLPWLVIAGMLLGCAGDAFLLNHHSSCFPLGLLSFFAGHVCYIIEMYRYMAQPVWWIVVLIAAVYTAGAAFTYKKLWPYLPKLMRVGALLYMLLLCMLSASAAVDVLSSFDTGAVVLLIGTLLFLFSDTILAFEVFRGETKNSHVKIMIPYIAAQTFIAAGFLIRLL